MRYSKWDGLLVALSLLYAAVLLGAPSVVVIALGLWWTSNTVSHNFVHLPFFRSRTLNRVYSMYLSLLTGVPQSFWRARHLAHHGRALAASPRSDEYFRQQAVEIGAVVALWGGLAWLDARFFLTTYVPGYLAGLMLCYVHGYFEHARGTVSHYGLAYNLAFFNDGYHVEHHGQPASHWTELPQRARPQTGASRWPAVLRWLEASNLERLERCVLHSAALQRFVLRTHERAFRILLAGLPKPRNVKIIGGGIFPRTALILQQLLPEAQLTIVDANAANLDTARGFLGCDVEFVYAVYEPLAEDPAELIVIPLAFIGDRVAVYRRRHAGATLIHDWLWARHGEGTCVSLLLLKRLNLVRA
jgi:hypothetical protein